MAKHQHNNKIVTLEHITTPQKRTKRDIMSNKSQHSNCSANCLADFKSLSSQATSDEICSSNETDDLLEQIRIC